MNVKSILASKGRDIFSIEPTATMLSAAQELTKRNVGALLVWSADGTSGILSERDVVRHLAEFGADALKTKVADVMTKDVDTCHEDDTVAQIMAKMTSKKFRHLPVVASFRLVGLVSIGDVVKSHVDQIEAEAAAMRNYIGGIA